MSVYHHFGGQVDLRGAHFGQGDVINIWPNQSAPDSQERDGEDEQDTSEEHDETERP